MPYKFSQILRCSFAISCLTLAACTTVEYVPIQQPTVAGNVIVSPHDPAGIALQKCDQLFARSGEAHRLCMMREIDRLKAQPVVTDQCGYTYGHARGCPGVPAAAGSTGSTIFIK